MAEATNESLRLNPCLADWLALRADGGVALRVGKVELGQGILTALAQIAADALGVGLDRIDIVSGDTAACPGEGYTAGSLSVEVTGAAVEAACATLRRTLLGDAARRLNCIADELRVVGGAVLRGDAGTGFSYAAPAAPLDLAAPVDPLARHSGPREWVGRSVPRIDLAAKLAGAAFIHDLAVPDMLHACAVRPPRGGATLAAFDPPAAEDLAGVTWLRDGNLLLAVAAGEGAAHDAARRAGAWAEWQGGRAIPDDAGAPEWLIARATVDRTLAFGARETPAGRGRVHEATYARPFLAHAAIGPACGLARCEAGRLAVWTHSQGVGPLRLAIARALGLEPGAVVVRHLPGAGCFGHNGADDAAFEAAFAALRLPGRTLRVRWSRADEMTAAPFGAAMAMRLSAELDPSGMPRAWTMHIWSPPHAARPGGQGGVNLAGAALMANPPPPPPPADIPDASGGGAIRNALAPYRLAGQTIHHHMIVEAPVRVSSFRTLGAFANVFAIESFMDELAAAAGRDPVDYRLALLVDPRARAVVEEAARIAGWGARRPGPDGGLGLAFARYKNRGAYCAVVAEVEAGAELRVRRLWAAVDAGLVVNPDGARAQVEGGLIQGASWTLKEAVRFAGGGIASADFASYPILRFSEVPAIDVALVDRPGAPPLGLGEAASGQAAAAIANAAARALGLRIRTLPMTRERIASLMLGPAD